MIVTPARNRRNRWVALLSAALVAAGLGAAALAEPLVLLALPLAPLVYWLCRRSVLRRLRAERRPFPPEWEHVLRTQVAFFVALDEAERERFRRMMRVFLSGVRVTGVRTDVDDQVMALVGASAVIPVFGFPDWEYAGLREVLIYPASFDQGYRNDGGGDDAILGMVGGGAMRGVMILSKRDLITGFQRPNDRLNVGLHEFVHLVDAADGLMDGLPPGVPRDLALQWVAWVAEELADVPDRPHVRPYAYTNELEYLATVAEYFFERPETLQRKDPVLYERLQRMFRQDVRGRLAGVRLPRRRKLGRNAPCPCGSGAKYKRCCMARARVARGG
jgi:Mlc titration factor MtfA (ptsG expression regulator)